MDLIFVSMEDWDDIWRRNQFVCAGLTRRFPDTRILFVGLARDVSNQIRRGKFRGALAASTQSIDGHPQITVTRPIKLLPNSIPLFRRFNESLMRSHVRKASQSIGLQSPVLWLNPHSAVHMIGSQNESAVIYDITDDWTSLTQSQRVRELTIVQDAEMCKRADAVIVCSQRLFEMKKDKTDRLHLIPNGVDSAHYSRVQAVDLEIPEAARSWQHPVLGYTGTIHKDRVDLELVETIARKMTAGSIALVGPSHLTEPDAARLLATGRIHITGAVPYSQIPDYMRAFDICITPHLVTSFTESLNPIKLWEYLAGGKPIISTPVAGFRDYPQHARLATGADAFLDAMQDALKETAERSVSRREEAAAHSWDSRIADICAVIESAKAIHLSGK